MAEYAFVVQGTPVGQPRARMSATVIAEGRIVRKGHAYNPSGSIDDWKRAIKDAALRYRPAARLEGPISVELYFIFPRPKSHFHRDGRLRGDAPTWKPSKPDADNCEKCVWDSLNGMGFWNDDAQICVNMTSKRYGESPGVTIRIETLEDNGPHSQL